jgi:uncharacterized membrane protein
MLVLDAAWLYANRAMYGRLVAAVQRSPLMLRAPAAALAYGAMLAGLLLIALPAARWQLASGAASDSAPAQQRSVAAGAAVLAALRHGGCLGLTVYGVYNATNAAIFNEYRGTPLLMDTVWGVVVYSVATYVGLVSCL